MGNAYFGVNSNDMRGTFIGSSVWDFTLNHFAPHSQFGRLFFTVNVLTDITLISSKIKLQSCSKRPNTSAACSCDLSYLVTLLSNIIADGGKMKIIIESIIL